MNFTSSDDHESVVKIINELLPGSTPEQDLIRKGAVPPLEIRIALGLFLSTFAYQTAKKLGDKVSDQALSTYETLVKQLGAVLKRFYEVSIPRRLPVTHVFTFNDNPIVELAVRSRDERMIADYLDRGRLCEVADRVDNLKSLFSPGKIQFHWIAGKWEFAWLMDRTGRVTGTPAVMNDKTRFIDLEKMSFSIGGVATRTSQDESENPG